MYRVFISLPEGSEISKMMSGPYDQHTVYDSVFSKEETLMLEKAWQQYASEGSMVT